MSSMANELATTIEKVRHMNTMFSKFEEDVVSKKIWEIEYEDEEEEPKPYAEESRQEMSMSHIAGDIAPALINTTPGAPVVAPEPPQAPAPVAESIQTQHIAPTTSEASVLIGNPPTQEDPFASLTNEDGEANLEPTDNSEVYIMVDAGSFTTSLKKLPHKFMSGEYSDNYSKFTSMSIEEQKSIKSKYKAIIAYRHVDNGIAKTSIVSEDYRCYMVPRPKEMIGKAYKTEVVWSLGYFSRNFSSIEMNLENAEFVSRIY